MKIQCEYNAEAPNPFSEAFFCGIAEETLKQVPAPFLQNKTITLSAVSVSRERILELNKTYRSKESVTDILSFGEYADLEAVSKEEKEEIFLGDLYFCSDYIEEAAKEDGVTFEHEMYYIFSHGVLHLLGYDHSDEMFAIQDAVTEKLLHDTVKEK
ncbi:MAG: rRNA maturation RNase YbeY [Patescibacteria group bacterium]